MIADNVKKQMRDLLREEIENITGDETFWEIFDQHVEAELAKTSCMIRFNDGEVSIYVGENSQNKDFKIADLAFWAEYDNFIPVSAEQAEEAERELRAIDNFSASVQELRAQVAANIDRYRAAKVSKPGNVV